MPCSGMVLSRELWGPALCRLGNGKEGSRRGKKDWDLGQSPHVTGKPIQTLHILKIDLLFKQKHKIDLS